jgi:hypothetical protein
MADWVTISSLATAGGTLALAVSTFAATRSSDRNARISELALRQQLRPVLMNSLFDDPEQKIMFFGGHWVRVPGGTAVAEVEDDVIYMSMSLRNVGSGIAVLLGWHVVPELTRETARAVPSADEFRPQLRDLWIPAGGVGLWQGAFRDAGEELYDQMRTAVESRGQFIIDLLYTDHIGGQREISRFSIVPSEENRWLCSVTRHWQVDD